MNIVLTLRLIKSQPQSAYVTLVSTKPLIRWTPVAFPAVQRLTAGGSSTSSAVGRLTCLGSREP